MSLTERLAAYLEEYFPDVPVYSEIDPNREWNGSAMIEIGEPDDPEFLTFLDGTMQTTRTLYATVRAATQGEAATAADTLETNLKTALESEETQGNIYTWAVDAKDVTPDARGVVSGESFYGYIEFTVIERN